MQSETSQSAPGIRGSGWRFTPTDGAIAACSLTVALAVSLCMALHLRAETRLVDSARAEALQRCGDLRQMLRHLELSRQALARLRRAANHYTAEVEARPIVPWTTVFNEVSRLRPRGVWAMRLTGDGPRFKVVVRAQRPDLVTAYAQQLRESPYVEFTALPAGSPAVGTGEVVGRLMGE